MQAGVVTLSRLTSSLVIGVVAAAAELVPALGAGEVHAAAFRQRVREAAVRTSCKRDVQVNPLIQNFINKLRLMHRFNSQTRVF